MTRHEHHEHFHFHQTKRGPRAKPKGFIKRTIRALAERFNVPRWVIICGFIFLFFMSVPLAILDRRNQSVDRVVVAVHFNFEVYSLHLADLYFLYL